MTPFSEIYALMTVEMARFEAKWGYKPDTIHLPVRMARDLQHHIHTDVDVYLVVFGGMKFKGVTIVASDVFAVAG